MLLLIDNWEHLLDGAQLLTDMLKAAPKLHILATSREKLNLTGETVFRLKGMIFPSWKTPEDAMEYDAVKLLVQVARRVKPDWDVTANNLDPLVRICRLTQGMPLGIVLAATWLDTLVLKDIADEIEQNVDFLDNEMRDLPKRLHSIRAVFEYSWNKLQPDEQQVFMKLSVFRGGFTRQAAESIAEANAYVLKGLVNKALITRDNTDRYALHELLRQYALKQLSKSGQLAATLEAHAQYFSDLIQQNEANIKGHKQTATIQEIKSDIDNIRSMWDRAIKTNNYGIYYQTTETLSMYCYLASYLIEGEQLFTSACLSLEQRLDSKDVSYVWSHLQLRLCWIRIWLTGIPKLHHEFLEQVEYLNELATDADNKTDIALSISLLGLVASSAKHPDALTQLEDSVSRFEQLGNKFYTAWGFYWLAYHWEEQDIETSLNYSRQSLALFLDLGGPSAISITVFNIAYYELELGNFITASSCLNQIEQLDAVWVPSVIDTLCGDILFFEGNFESARQVGTALLNRADMTGEVRTKHFANQLLGIVACVEADYQTALGCYEKIMLTDPRPRHLVYAKWLLGMAACGLGEYPRAIEATHYVLWSSMRIGAIGRITWALPTLTIIEKHRCNYERAIQFLSLAFNHPKSITGWLEKWSLIKDLKNQLILGLGDEAYQSFWEKSESLDLTQLVSEWLTPH